MFLVKDPGPGGSTDYVFVHLDPRLDGRTEGVEENVEFEPCEPATWHDGQPMPNLQRLGVDRADRSRYRVFASEAELVAAGYEPLSGQAYSYARWEQHRRTTS